MVTIISILTNYYGYFKTDYKLQSLANSKNQFFTFAAQKGAHLRVLCK